MSVKWYKLSSFTLLNYPHSELNKTLQLAILSEKNLPNEINDFPCNFVDLAETSHKAKQMGWLEGFRECLFFCLFSHWSNDWDEVTLAPWNPTCLGVGCPSACEVWLTYSTTGSIQDSHSSMDNLDCMVSWADRFLADCIFQDLCPENRHGPSSPS